MTRCPHQDTSLAAGAMVVDGLPTSRGGDNIVTALKDQRRYRDIGKVRPIVGHEGNACECLGDLRIGSAAAVRSSSPSSGRSALPMIAGAMAADQPISPSDKNRGTR